jgi:hypothetical protein
MTGFLVGTHRQVQAAKARGDTGLGKEALNALWSDYQMILTAGEVQSPARVHPKTGGRIAQTEPRRLLNRLGPHQDDVLRFATNFTVPFDNYADIGITTTTKPNGTSEWSSSAKKFRGACAQPRARNTS